MSLHFTLVVVNITFDILNVYVTINNTRKVLVRLDGGTRRFEVPFEAAKFTQ